VTRPGIWSLQNPDTPCYSHGSWRSRNHDDSVVEPPFSQMAAELDCRSFGAGAAVSSAGNKRRNNQWDVAEGGKAPVCAGGCLRFAFRRKHGLPALTSSQETVILRSGDRQEETLPAPSEPRSSLEITPDRRNFPRSCAPQRVHSVRSRWK
jgi:hypothetical protein